MTRRLLLSYLSITVLVLVMLEVPLAAFYAQRERERIEAAVEHDATVIATIYEDALEAGGRLDPAPAQLYEETTSARVVVVDADGISRVDTGQAAERDFSSRPEIITALGGSTATGTRTSETLDADILYVAVPVASGGVVHGAVRLTLDVSEVDARIQRFWLALIAVDVVVLAAVAVIGWVIARSVTRPVRQLHAAATRFAAGDLSASPPVTSGPPELRELDTAMATMAGRLDELLRAQRRFVADASHQLRTPLTALRLRLENLQSRLAGADAAEGASAVDETERLSALVTDLLRLARADEHRAVAVIDVAGLARDRVDTWTAVAEADGVSLDYLGPDRAPALATDGAVEQILDNLLENALRFTGTGTTVTVRVESAPGSVTLAVDDQGPGLSDADKLLAPQRFWRGDTGVPGTGLGLAIVQALAEASGGTMQLADAPGGGLSVVVELPSEPTP